MPKMYVDCQITVFQALHIFQACYQKQKLNVVFHVSHIKVPLKTNSLWQNWKICSWLTPLIFWTRKCHWLYQSSAQKVSQFQLFNDFWTAMITNDWCTFVKCWCICLFVITMWCDSICTYNLSIPLKARTVFISWKDKLIHRR